MTDLFSYIGMFLSNSWKMLTTIKFPGTNMSIAVILVGMFLIIFGWRILGFIFGFSLSDVERVNKRIIKAKIAKERQNDER